MLLVGIPLLLIGCAPILAVIVGAWVPWSLVVFIPFGVLATFGRSQFEIDGNSRTYRKRFGILIGRNKLIGGKGTSGSIDQFGEVIVFRDVRTHTDSDGYPTTSTVYPVRLIGLGEGLHLWDAGKVPKAKSLAEQVAKALDLPLVDRTGPSKIVREVENLDESLRERRRRTGERLGKLPPRPKNMTAEVRIEDGEVLLEIPPIGAPPESDLVTVVVALLLSAGVGSGVIYFFLEFSRIDDLFFQIFGGVFASAAAFFFILLPVFLASKWVLRAIRRHYTVRLSPEKLHVTTYGVLFTRAAEIPADELEELTLNWSTSSSGRIAQIVARSDRKTLEFSGRFSSEEANWIKQALEHALTA